MKTVIAREVPGYDLSVTFSVQNDAGKYDQYRITYAYLLANYPDIEPRKAATLVLEKHFKKTLGENTELTIELSDYNVGLPRRITAIDESLFNKKTINALKQVKTTGTIHQYDMNVSAFPDVVARFLDRVSRVINLVLINPINKLLHTAYGLDPVRKEAYISAPSFSLDSAISEISITDPGKTDLGPTVEQALELANEYINEKYNTKYQDYLDLAATKFFLPYLVQNRFSRTVTTVSYVVVACGEDDLGEAIESIARDLDLMAGLGLIMGNLTMPSIVELANTIGNGKKIYAVHAFPILNSQQLMKISNKPNPLDLSQAGYQELKSLGVANLVYEGGVNYLNGKTPYADLGGEDIEISEIADSVANDKAELQRLYEQMNADNQRVKAKEAARRAAQQKQNAGDKN